MFSRLYGNYAGLSNSDDLDAHDEPVVGDSAAGGRQYRASGQQRQPCRGTSTSSCGTRMGTSTSSAAWRPIGLTRSSSTGGPIFPTGTQVGAFFYGASGTPVSRMVQSVNRIPIFVDGRGSLGRTPFLSADRPARVA